MSDSNTASPTDKFQWTAREWHAPSVDAMGYVADLVYSDGETVEKALSPLRMRFLEISVDDVDIFLLATETRVLIGARGSQMKRKDWLYNIAFWPKSCDFMPGKMHGGYKSGLQKVMPVITSQLHKWGVGMSSVEHVIGTGHSQGAALADAIVECLIWLYNLNPSKTLKYTYAEPRLWGRSANPKGRNIRVMHERDIVPMFPLPIRFKHVGELHVLFDDGSHVADMSLPDLRKLRFKTFRRLAVMGVFFQSRWWIAALRALFVGGRSHSMTKRYRSVLAKLT